MYEPLRCIAAAILILLFGASTGSAQTATGGQTPSPTTKVVSGAFSTPEDPVLALLGVAPQAIFRPSSPSALGTYLVNGMDENGNLKTGLAIQTAPYFLLHGAKITLEEYRRDWAVRALSNVQLSLATTKGASDEDKSVRGAIGLRWVIFDRGDPRLSTKLGECFYHALPLPPVPGTLPSETGVKPLPDEAVAAWKRCLDEHKEEKWNASAWDIGFVPSWTSPDGSLNKFRSATKAVYSTLAYGFEHLNSEFLSKNAQIIFHARYIGDESVPIEGANSQFITQDSVSFGGRLRFGGARFAFSVEGLYTISNPDGGRKDASYRVAIASDIRLTDGVYLEVGLGGTAGRRNQNDEALLLTQIKWNIFNNPELWKSFLARDTGTR
jgi:hypothetical protein